MAPIPIVIIGRKASVATRVKAGMLPEYEAIHVILSEEQALTDLPLLLSNPLKQPPNSSENHGTQNYSYPKVLAVTAGGGFNDEQFQLVKDACKDVEDGVLWIRADMSKVDTMPPLNDMDAYAAESAKRAKQKLNDLRADGVSSGVHFFT